MNDFFWRFFVFFRVFSCLFVFFRVFSRFFIIFFAFYRFLGLFSLIFACFRLFSFFHLFSLFFHVVPACFEYQFGGLVKFNLIASFKSLIPGQNTQNAKNRVSH